MDYALAIFLTGGEMVSAPGETGETTTFAYAPVYGNWFKVINGIWD